MKWLLFLSLLPLTAYAGNELGNGRATDGNEMGNGGDLVAQEFTAAARKLVEQLKTKPDPRITDLDKLEKAVADVRVTSAGHLTLHGAEVDAINYPEQREIDVNRPRWEAADPEKRASLVLHEYLGIVQVNDLHYEISSSYAAPFAVPEEKPKRFEVGLGSSFGWLAPGTEAHMRSTQPGVSFKLGYYDSSRNEIVASYDRQSYGFSDDGAYRDTRTHNLAIISYRRWFSDSRNFRPFLGIGEGLKWENYETVFYDPRNPYLEEHFGGGKAYIKPVTRFAAGIRHLVAHDVSFEVSANYDKMLFPWGMSRWDATLNGQASMQVLF